MSADGSEAGNLKKKIDEQGEKVRQLKASKAPEVSNREIQTGRESAPTEGLQSTRGK
jgi:hypothetical protein